MEAMPPLPSLPSLPQPDAFIPYHVPQPSRRPTSVLVLGVIGIVISAIVLLMYVVAIAILIAFSNSLFNSAVFGASTDERVWKAVQWIASWTFHSVLLWASIGAIRLRPWARPGLVRWAWVYLVWIAIEAAIIAIWVLPSAAYDGSAAAPATMQPSELMAGYLALVISVVGSVIYPIFVIVFMGKPHVIAAFAAAAAAPDTSTAAQATIPVAGFAPAGSAGSAGGTR